MMRLKDKGFTLIELLVVIAVIGMLASIVLVSLSPARAKARDAKTQAAFQAVSTALDVFYEKEGRMPNNYNPGSGACEGDGFYEQSMQELVSAGVLSVIPKSPSDSRYCYYNYGPGDSAGALMVTHLEAAPQSDTGLAPSCRPWPAGTNWCDKSTNRYYCLCHPY